MFRNPSCKIDQFNEGAPYVLNGNPGIVAYTLDDYRIEVLTVAPSQLTVSRGSGLFNPQFENCLQIMTTQPRSSVSLTGDNCNLEIWVEPTDEIFSALRWGTPGALPLTISFDTQFDLPGKITFSMHNWNNSVSCCQELNYPSAAPISRAQITFPPMPTGDFSLGAKFVINLGFPSGGTYATDASNIGVVVGAAWFQINGNDQLIDKPTGTALRFGNFQADVGSVALPYRHKPKWMELNSCREVFQKTHPVGVPVNKPGGYPGSLLFIGTPDAAAGVAVPWRFPVPMISRTLNIRTFSTFYKNDPNWFRANGELSSGKANIVSQSSEGLSISNSVVGDPNGSAYFLHAVAYAQLGGNGWL